METLHETYDEGDKSLGAMVRRAMRRRIAMDEERLLVASGVLERPLTDLREVT